MNVYASANSTRPTTSSLEMTSCLIAGDALIRRCAASSDPLLLTVLVDLKPTKHAERRAVGDTQEGGTEDTKSDRQTAAELAGANGVAHRE